MKILKILLYILITVLLLGGIYSAYNTYSEISKQPKEALHIIPENAAIIFSARDYVKLRNELNSAYTIWDIFKTDNTVSEYLTNMDSVWNKVISLNVNSNKPKSYFSIHYNAKNKFSSLLCFSYNYIIPEKLLFRALDSFGKHKIQTFKTKTIYSITTSNKSTYNICNIEGNILISESKTLIERAIIQSNTKANKETKSIDQLIKIAGKDASSNIFINHNYFYRLLSLYSSKDYINNLRQLSNFTQFSVLDFKIDNDNILLNGYSLSSDSVSSRINTYQGYKPATINIFDHIPNTTNFIYYQGVEKFSDFIIKQNSSKYCVQEVSAIKKYEADIMTNLGNYFYPWIKSELALVSFSMNNKQQDIVLIDSYDLKETEHTLNNLKTIITDHNNNLLHTDSYRNYIINKIQIPYLLPKLFGKMFASLENSYFIITSEYAIFANSKQALKNYIDKIIINKTLANRKEFSKFKESINYESHILLYSNAHYFNNLTKQFLNTKTKNYLNKSEFNPQLLGDFCLQFIVNPNGAFTSITINTNDNIDIEDNTSWQLALDSDIKSGPFIIKNHRTNENNILVFDKNNTMYRINNSGKIKWAIPVEETPIGTPIVVDAFNNGKFQFIYNSKKHIYMFDLNGNSVDNYPILLDTKATAPLSVIDYDNKGNYRIIIPQQDGKIYNYQIDGNKTKGWKLPSMPATVKTPVQHFNIENKDFILLADSAGNVVFSNRRGVARISTKLAFTNNINTPFYKSNNYLITTDKSGRLIKIGKEGKVIKTLFRDFSNKHLFYLFDINGDGNKEIIYYDNNKLYIFNNKKNLLWAKEFNSDISPPQYISNTLEDSMKLVIYNKTSQLFEFGNSKGLFNSNNEFIGSNNFLLYKATNTSNTRLISVKGRIVSNYLLK